MGCNERVGNLLLLLCVVHTTGGIEIMKPGWKLNNITQRQFKNCIKLQLGFQKWIHEFNDKPEVDNAYPLVAELITMIKHCFPRTDGYGWKIPKMHALAIILHYVQKFGCASGFSGETGERFLKSIVKDMARITQQRATLFAEQCAFRLYEHNVCTHAYQCAVVPELALDYEKVKDVGNGIECHGSGEFTLTIEDVDHHGRGFSKVVWKSRNREKLKIGISELMKIAIRKYASGKNWTGMFQITGYTSMKIRLEGYEEHTLFHANEFLRGEKWYDWAMVQFEGDEDEPLEDLLCPAKVLGFFKYADSGHIPTPFLIEEMGYSPEQIYREGLTDNSIYAVVHTASETVPWYNIMNDFVSSFYLGNVKGCVYIVDIKCIKDPLFVFQDIGGVAPRSDKYFCVLPYKKWGRYFGDKVKLEGEDDDVNDGVNTEVNVNE